MHRDRGDKRAYSCSNRPTFWKTITKPGQSQHLRQFHSSTLPKPQFPARLQPRHCGLERKAWQTATPAVPRLAQQVEESSMTTVQANRPAMLKRAVALESEDAEFAQFLRAAALATDSEDLARETPERLEATMRQSHAQLNAYDGTGSRLSATEPAQAGDPLVLDIVSPDMPFIVDSALAALRAGGGTVRLFSHPVVRQADGGALSVLHIHSDPVSDLPALLAEIEATMGDVGLAVHDWQPMLDRLRKAIAELGGQKASQINESLRFLDWLVEHNFTFLGMRDYHIEGDVLAPVANSGLGILTDP